MGPLPGSAGVLVALRGLGRQCKDDDWSGEGVGCGGCCSEGLEGETREMVG